MGLAVFDTHSTTEFILSPRGDRIPLRRLEERRILLENVRPTQVLVEGTWTVAFDIPGDEVARIDALVADHSAVFLVWNGRILTTWESGDIDPVQKRYSMSMYMISPGFSDEATAVEVAEQLRDLHSVDARAATQLGPAAGGASSCS